VSVTALTTDLTADDYRFVLAEYLSTLTEESLYRCSLLSQSLVESGLGPEDILALHVESLEGVIANLRPRDQIRAHEHAHEFLLEVMIAYGVHYRQYLELRLQQAVRDAEEQARVNGERAIEAERLGREREDILAMIAHELRTPLTAAMTSIELIERSVSMGETEMVAALVERARQGLLRLSRLSADLVEATRGDPGALDFTEVDVHEIVMQACNWVSALASAKEVHMQLDGAGGPLTISGNADALLSVVGNLLSNAVRYTPAGGRVIVRSGGDKEHVWVEVEDTGIGISEEAQARIFEKFYRAPEARSTEARGLGLGLALVQQMVSAHNGEITVSSAPGRGSLFRVVLPRHQATQEEARP